MKWNIYALTGSKLRVTYEKSVALPTELKALPCLSAIPLSQSITRACHAAGMRMKCSLTKSGDHDEKFSKLLKRVNKVREFSSGYLDNLMGELTYI